MKQPHITMDRNIFYLLGTAMLSVGITSLLFANVGVVSSCILIGLGAECMKGYSKQDCCSLRGTAIAAIVLSSLEFIVSLILFAVFFSFTGLYQSVSSGCCSCYDYAFSTILGFPGMYIPYNFGASVFGLMIKVSLSALFLFLTARHDDENLSTQQPLSRVYHGLGSALLSVGIVSLLSVHLGLISSCLIISLGAHWMQLRNKKNIKSILLKRGFISLYGTAITIIVLTSIEAVASISLFASFITITTGRTTASECYRYVYDNYNCLCTTVAANISAKTYFSYNLGAVLCGSVIKYLLCWITLTLTSGDNTSDEGNQEGSALLGGPALHIGSSTQVGVVRNNKNYDTKSLSGQQYIP